VRVKRQQKDRVEPSVNDDQLKRATSILPDEAFAFDLAEVLGEDAPPGQQKPTTVRVKGPNVPEVVRPPK